MSTASPVINQNIEIISAICKSPVAFDGILSYLQTTYPTTGWTSTLLTTRLNAGVRQGLFTKVGSNPAGPVLGYKVNPNMLTLNYSKNALYEPFCSNVIPMGCAPSANSGAGTGTGGSS